MKNELLPTKFPGISDNVYTGFGPRIAAKIIDFIVLLPVVGLLLYINGLSKSAYFYAVVPNLLFGIWFEVYLVKRYGGTPGKLMMGIKIIKNNGADVDWRAAFYRYSVELFLAILGVYVMILTLNLIDDNTYISLGFMKRNQLIATLNPIPGKVHSWLNALWVVTGLIVLVSDRRKRSTHDFIAGTVVIKSIFLDKIRETINYSTTDEVEL
ncbi:MAG TPA: RDD family protein [Paludibacter sp.]|nr:RDD family protein [Paludibacter sp.]